jgi:hypothetical protein
MIIETGLLRLTVPDEARDDSFHTFRRSAAESVSVDVLPAARATPSGVVADRTADVESWANDLAPRSTPRRTERAVAIPGLRDAVVVHLDVGELDSLQQVYLAGRLASGDVVCVRQSRRSVPGELDDTFEGVVASARAGTAVAHQRVGWRARLAHSLAFELPEDFAAPHALAFTAPEWRLAVSHGADRVAWQASFRSTDELQTLDRKEHEAQLGAEPRRWTESTHRVTRRRPPVTVDGVVISAEIIDDYIIREAGLDDIVGRPLHFVGVALSRHESSLDVAWRSVRSSLEEHGQ